MGSLRRWSASCPVPSRARSRVWRRWAQHTCTHISMEAFLPYKLLWDLAATQDIHQPVKSLPKQKLCELLALTVLRRGCCQEIPREAKFWLLALCRAEGCWPFWEQISHLLEDAGEKSHAASLEHRSEKCSQTFLAFQTNFLSPQTQAAALISLINYWEGFACSHCIVQYSSTHTQTHEHTHCAQ